MSRTLTGAALAAVALAVFSSAVAHAQAVEKKPEKPTEKTSEKPSDKFADLQIAVDDDEVTSGRKASLIRALNRSELEAFVSEMSNVFPIKASFEVGQALRTIEIIRRHKDFSKADAKVILGALSKQTSETSYDGRIRALRVRLKGVAGDLSKTEIEQELTYLNEAKRPSADRLAVLGALTDAMTEIGQKPPVEILEKLLGNDVYEIRIHAIDWFRLSRAIPIAEKIKFLKLAIRVSPYQARERAYRALLSYDDKEFISVYSAIAGPSNGVSCVVDANEKTRKLCQDADARAISLQKAKAP